MSRIYAELSSTELTSRVAQLTSLLKQPGRCSPLEVDLELHQVELELQNRELKDALAELEISRAAYADLFDCAPFGYVILDRHGVIVDLNLPAASMLQRMRKQLVGKPFLLYLFGITSTDFIEYLRQSDGSPWLTVDLRPAPGGTNGIPVQLYTQSNGHRNGYRISMQPLVGRTCANCDRWQRAANDDRDLPPGWGWCGLMEATNEFPPTHHAKVCAVANGPACVLTAPSFACNQFKARSVPSSKTDGFMKT